MFTGLKIERIQSPEVFCSERVYPFFKTGKGGKTSEILWGCCTHASEWSQNNFFFAPIPHSRDDKRVECNVVDDIDLNAGRIEKTAGFGLPEKIV